MARATRAALISGNDLLAAIAILASGQNPDGSAFSLPSEPAAPTPGTATFTILNGASLSDAIDLAGASPIRLLMPAAWDAASITVQVSTDGATFYNLYDQYGVEYTIVTAVSRAIIIEPANFVGVRYVKLRSGPSGAAVNQTAQRSLILETRPI